MSDEVKFEGWSVLELMGHRKLGGYVTETTVAGAGFLRIDVPGANGEPVVTQFVSPQSVYALTPVTEAMARAVAARNVPQPVARWELPAAKDADENPQQAMDALRDGDDLDGDDDGEPIL